MVRVGGGGSKDMIGHGHAVLGPRQLLQSCDDRRHTDPHKSEEYDLTIFFIM